MNPHPDPNVLDSIDQDIEFIELKIKSVLARVPERALENARKQLSLLKEARDKYVEAMRMQIGPTTVVTTNPGTCGIPSHYANPQDLSIAKVPDSYYYESLTKKE
jgi:hypothetical protein